MTPSLQHLASELRADDPCRTLVLAPDARRWPEEREERPVLKLSRYLLAGRFRAEPGTCG